MDEIQQKAEAKLAKAFEMDMPDMTGLDNGMRKELVREHIKVEKAMEKVNEATRWREKQEKALREEQVKVGVLVATEWKEALAEIEASKTAEKH